jgi:hypothetical protein
MDTLIDQFELKQTGRIDVVVMTYSFLGSRYPHSGSLASSLLRMLPSLPVLAPLVWEMKSRRSEQQDRIFRTIFSLKDRSGRD